MWARIGGRRLQVPRSLVPASGHAEMLSRVFGHISGAFTSTDNSPSEQAGVTVSARFGPFTSDADDAYLRLRSKLVVKPVDVKSLANADGPTPPGHVRLVCISDTHNQHESLVLPRGDILVHAGDFSGRGRNEEIARFVDWVKRQPFEHKVVIAGNHEMGMDPKLSGTAAFEHRRALEEACTYLHDGGATVAGLTFYGSPVTPVFYDWAFNEERGYPIRKFWERIPADVDVLITHGPPLGHGDLCSHGGRAGCADLLMQVEERIMPRYHIFGHIHEAYGVTTNDKTIFVNPASCNLRYRPVQAPIVIDVPLRRLEPKEENQDSVMSSL